MRKAVILLSLMFSVSLNYIRAQPSAYIDGANIKAKIYANGELFQDHQTLSSAFEVPKNSGNHVLYSSGLWLSSVETKNGKPNYAISYTTYGGNYRGFRTGPVDIVNQVADQSQAFQKLWKINRSEIDQHIQNWQSPGYTTPNSIASWPGNGGINNASKLAPFMDIDNDDIYEPQDGEYPLIKGDQAVYLIANDYRLDDSATVPLRPGVDSTVSYSQSTKSEIHMMLYVYSQSNTDVMNTVFVNVKLINRSNSPNDNYSNFKLTVFSDPDVGYAFDDYVGTDTSNNMYYSYNGDNFDEAGHGVPGYGNNLPAIGIKFLSNRLRHSLYYINGNGSNGNPNTLLQYDRYLASQWKDGTPVMKGGDGYASSCVSNKPVKFMFDGDPTLSNQNGEWTESSPCINGSSQPNSPGDRRMIGGPDLPTSYGPGDTIEFDYAYIFAQKANASNPGEAVAELFNAASTVQTFYDNNVVTGTSGLSATEKPSFEVFPNPADERIRISTSANNFTLDLLTIDGSVVRSYHNQKAINLNQLAKGIYFIKLKTESQQSIKKLIVK